MASEENSFMVNFCLGVDALAQLARAEGLPLLSNDQSDDGTAISPRGG